MGSLNETLSAEGIWSILAYHFYPFGNAYYPQNDCPGRVIYERDAGLSCWQNKCGNINSGDQPASECFTGAPICQHGDLECKGNRFETCAIAIGSIQTAAEFTYCYEGTNELSNPEGCAGSVGLDWSSLSACYNSSSTDILVEAIANTTAVYAVENGWVGTPTVVLNDQAVATTDGLLLQVCIAAGDDAPAGCP